MKNFILIAIICFYHLSAWAQQNLPAKLKIAYNVLYNDSIDDYEIFTMNLDGSERKNISNWKGVDWVYYAYKDKIYFISDRDTAHRMYFLYEMDVHGKDIRKVSAIRLADSWHSTRNSGKEMIVRPLIKNKSWFYIIDVSSGKIKDTISIPQLALVNDPCFSPDGKKIVFRGAKEKPAKDNQAVDELFIINDDGSHLFQLTQYPKNDTTAKWHDYHAGPPKWEKNKNIITYQSLQNGKYSLYAIKPDGKGFRKLTSNTIDEGWHDWSPDGKFLAVECFNTAQSEFDIYLMDENGIILKNLKGDFKYEQSPVFVEIK